jgi:hypothetical protein
VPAHLLGKDGAAAAHVLRAHGLPAGDARGGDARRRQLNGDRGGGGAAPLQPPRVAPLLLPQLRLAVKGLPGAPGGGLAALRLLGGPSGGVGLLARGDAAAHAAQAGRGRLRLLLLQHKRLLLQRGGSGLQLRGAGAAHAQLGHHLRNHLLRLLRRASRHHVRGGRRKRGVARAALARSHGGGSGRRGLTQRIDVGKGRGLATASSLQVLRKRHARRHGSRNDRLAHRLRRRRLQRLLRGRGGGCRGWRRRRWRGCCASGGASGGRGGVEGLP